MNDEHGFDHRFGHPNTAPEYILAVEALYAMAYTLKFRVKNDMRGVDYAVMPLEGLWWVDDMKQFNVNNKEAWKWTMMIMQPEYVTANLFSEALNEMTKKKGLPELSITRFEPFHERQSAQIMHIGPTLKRSRPSQNFILLFIRTASNFRECIMKYI